MKYYCENCGIEIEVLDIKLSKVCPICSFAHILINRRRLAIDVAGLYLDLKPLPARETVAQWEERKGRKYPDTAPVYVWRDDAKAWGLRERYRVEHETWNIQVVATEAGAPPDDWRPE